MTELTRVTIVSTAETALKKLKNAKIGVYDCKKDGARFLFSIKDKDVKKVFAIFSKPCYNICVQQSRREKLLSRAFARIGLIAGSILFVLIAAISNSFIFRIEVSGSGSYLSADVRRIVYEQGFSEFKAYRNFDAPKAEGKILALPQVTFCKIEKHGSVLIIDVQVDGELNGRVNPAPLVSDRNGVVKNLVVICGTPAVSVNYAVKAGDTLIYAHTSVGDGIADCIAVGYAEIECKGSYDYSAPAESETALKSAYSKANLYAENITNRTHTVKTVDGGVVYIIEFTYLQKLSINME